MPPNRKNRGEPAEGSLNLSCPHRENTYALLEWASSHVCPSDAQVRGWLLLVSVDLTGRVQYHPDSPGLHWLGVLPGVRGGGLTHLK